MLQASNVLSGLVRILVGERKGKEKKPEKQGLGLVIRQGRDLAMDKVNYCCRRRKPSKERGETGVWIIFIGIQLSLGGCLSKSLSCITATPAGKWIPVLPGASNTVCPGSKASYRYNYNRVCV